MVVRRGTLVVVGLDPTVGHEQRGLRPCVVVSDPEVAAEERFPMLCVVPITGTAARGLLYPPLAPGPASGLVKRSYVLVDQLRSIDKRRVVRVLGHVASSELAAIDEGLRMFLGLDA